MPSSDATPTSQLLPGSQQGRHPNLPWPANSHPSGRTSVRQGWAGLDQVRFVLPGAPVFEAEAIHAIRDRPRHVLAPGDRKPYRCRLENFPCPWRIQRVVAESGNAVNQAGQALKAAAAQAGSATHLPERTPPLARPPRACHHGNGNRSSGLPAAWLPRLPGSGATGTQGPGVVRFRTKWCPQELPPQKTAAMRCGESPAIHRDAQWHRCRCPTDWPPGVHFQVRAHPDR